jgi:hypothetical protein
MKTKDQVLLEEAYNEILSVQIVDNHLRQYLFNEGYSLIEIERIMLNEESRRDFLKKLGLAGAAALGLGSVARADDDDIEKEKVQQIYKELKAEHPVQAGREFSGLQRKTLSNAKYEAETVLKYWAKQGYKGDWDVDRGEGPNIYKNFIKKYAYVYMPGLDPKHDRTLTGFSQKVRQYLEQNANIRNK